MIEKNLLENAEKAAYNKQLTSYIQLLTDEQLDDLTHLIVCDDIVGVRVNILDCIKQEQQYRNCEEVNRNKNR